MTYSLTRTSTFTITEARYIASKLGADLRNLNARYGRPRLDWIPDYVEETAQYLKASYLDYVDFGFKKRRGVEAPAALHRRRRRPTPRRRSRGVAQRPRRCAVRVPQLPEPERRVPRPDHH